MAAALPERRGTLARLVLLAVVAAIAEGSGLVVLAYILNRLPASEVAAGLRLERAILAYVAIAAIAAAASWAQSVQTARLRLEAADRLRRAALHALLDASWPALLRVHGPAATQIITVEAGRVGNGINYLMTGVAIAIRLPVLFAVAFRLAPLLAVATLAVCGTLAFLTSRADRLARRSGERMLKTGRAVQTRVTEALAGRRVIKAFGLERARAEAFDQALDDGRAAHLAQQRAFAGGTAMMQFAVPTAVALALWVAVRMMGLALGSALVFAFAFGRLGQSVLSLRAARRIVIGAMPAEAAVRELIDDARRAVEPHTATPLRRPERDIVLDDVSLQHQDGALAVAGVSFTIPAGTVTAIVGPSGAGKSTLSDLVMGLAVPTSGSIALDGVPLDAAGRRAWRRHVGYVPQDAFLFHETIRDNLLAARPDATEADLWQALDAADAGDLVRALPEGLETIVGERGARLSGGEAQRVALARALLRDPALLVLDEPTSALDAESESRIIATLHRLKGRHTIVIVAHRAALAAIADQTIRLDRGRRVP